MRISFVVFVLLVFAAGCSKKEAPPATELTPDQLQEVVNVRNYGAIGDGITNDSIAIAAAMGVAHTKKVPLYFPSGKYVARIVFNFDSLSIIGIKKAGRWWDSTGAIILGSVDCNYKKDITITNIGIDSRGRLLPGDDAALTSGRRAGNQPLRQTFKNIGLIGDGYASYTHGMLCQAGTHITIKDIYVYSFYHGIAIRNSDVTIDGVTADFCGFTSVIVKSDQQDNKLTQNVTIRNVRINGNPADAYKRGGAIIIQSYSDSSLTQNIVVDSVYSVSGGVGVVNVQQIAGLVKNINIGNCYAENCGDDSTRAAYDILGGVNIRYENCKTVNCSGIGFRVSNNAVSAVVVSSQESKSAVAAWRGPFSYLQLNGVEIIK